MHPPQNFASFAFKKLFLINQFRKQKERVGSLQEDVGQLLEHFEKMQEDRGTLLERCEKLPEPFEI